MGKFIDLTGQRFGWLVVVERAENRKRGTARWLCRCDCGNEKIIDSSNLRQNHSRSCGCAYKGKGVSRSRIYCIWVHIKSRCYAVNDKAFKNYGGRGITMCEEWRNDFKAFQAWAVANGYTDELSIDRIDVNGNYEPSNCRWATWKEQCNNMRKSLKIEFKGESRTLSEWSVVVSIPRSTIVKRLKLGWSVEKALTTPSEAQNVGRRETP